MTFARAAHDDSSIDYVLMPQSEPPTEKYPEITRIPLLPNNFVPPERNSPHHEVIEPVVRPQISTASADSTHIESPSAMREVTDNHAVELDPFTLTEKVAKAASKLGHVPVSKATQEVGALRELWNGLLDDLLGEKRVTKS